MRRHHPVRVQVVHDRGLSAAVRASDGHEHGVSRNQSIQIEGDCVFAPARAYALEAFKRKFSWFQGSSPFRSAVIKKEKPKTVSAFGYVAYSKTGKVV